MCVNFILFLRSGAEGIFHHFFNSLHGFKFIMHVSDADSINSASFMKF